MLKLKKKYVNHSYFRLEFMELLNPENLILPILASLNY
jgi:hypothetical protein